MQKVLSVLAGLHAALEGPARNDLTCCPGPDGSCSSTFMTQWIDHSNHSVGTFQQGIQVITEHFKPGGPILLFYGEESTEMECVETTSMYDYARQLGGIAATIEHRYFGSSTPFGPDKSYTPEGFAYLTLDNVMDDAVRFIQEIQTNITGAASSRAIVASGSYGGFVTAALRLNRPDSIFGAIAAAPPTNIFLTKSGDVPGRFDQWNWISNVISERSAAAAAAIKDAFTAFGDAIAQGDMDDLQVKLNLCRTPKGPDDIAVLAQLMTLPYLLVTQYNDAYASCGRSPIAKPLDHLIDVVLRQRGDPFDILKSTGLLWFKALDPSVNCLNIDTDSPPVLPTLQLLPFGRIVCTYLPIVNTGISKDTIFLPQDPDPSILNLSCNSTYGVTPLTAEQLMENYNMSQASYESSERIIFSVGEYDGVTALGPPRLPSTANRNASKILYVSNMSHREELLAPDPRDKPEIIRARAIEVETIKGWLGVV